MWSIAYNDALSIAHCRERGEMASHATFALSGLHTSVVVCIEMRAQLGIQHVKELSG
jgi:hypothetical protein